jgi:hypothetical protein
LENTEYRRAAYKKYYMNNRAKELKRVKKYHMEHSLERKKYLSEYYAKRKLNKLE